jgi:aspartate aminotransferase
VKPDGAFYVMMNISGVLGRRAAGRVLSGAMDFSGALLESVGVAVVPGDDFGAGHHVRLSYAVSMADIDRGMDRIASFVDGLE